MPTYILHISFNKYDSQKEKKKEKELVDILMKMTKEDKYNLLVKFFLTKVTRLVMQTDCFYYYILGKITLYHHKL